MGGARIFKLGATEEDKSKSTGTAAFPALWRRPCAGDIEK